MSEKKTTTTKKTTVRKSTRMTAAKAKEALLPELPPMPKGDRVVAMIHFNTPEITEAAVHSIRTHGGER